MTSYNVAVTVCPVIFRPRVQHAEEITGVGTIYDAFIRMIDNYQMLFEDFADDTTFSQGGNPVPAQTQKQLVLAKSISVNKSHLDSTTNADTSCTDSNLILLSQSHQ